MLNKMSFLQELYKSRFRGCLLGALVGDCLGAPFEGDTISAGDKLVIRDYLNKLENPNHKEPTKMYTDDTAMTRSIGKFLVDKPEPDFSFLARLFVKDYYLEPNRGYGGNVIKVFEKLKLNKFQDVYKPASEQFGGSGSLGNGGAMRIAPIALCFHDNSKKMLNIARKATEITHTNSLGVNGALLQCLAVQQSLGSLANDSSHDSFALKFVSKLIFELRRNSIECSEEDLNDAEMGALVEEPYREKLLLIENLIQRKYEANEIDDEVIETLGNDISALGSVPTAIFCFLKAYRETEAMKNVFRNTLEYAISLGGDTDTIASMACAIAGAFLGEENINPQLIKRCEKYEEVIEMADNLLEVRQTEYKKLVN